ncbi:DUF3857 domain-containing protein [candidate division WOR-3 bacterium]|uniref:DUF3857 domain-containing protein n=1 Tax=candidate division WOR-3 bacterium TaxID=2052148 RepID=A0A9D5K8B1_UNCW3|nr:DUF3857 domain-containing protein [candidate division WOR-3 bacterium]MBD3364278.1 DUF3857 domain-containing protein [candidate division WOR-3 bacterium]
MKHLFIPILFCVAGLEAVKVEFHDTTLLDTETLELTGQVVYTDQDTFTRRSIKVITLSTQSPVAKEPEEIEHDVGHLLNLSVGAKGMFPEVKGILLIDDGRYNLNTDGTRSYSYHKAYLILSKSKLSHATFRRSFEEGENQVNVHFARVIKPDGRVFELPPNQIKMQTPPTKGSLFFRRDKIVTFTLPDVEIGDIVEYSFENIQFNPWNREIFEASYYFQDSDPFIFSRMVVDVPEAEILKQKTYNMPEGTSEPGIVIEDGRKTYTWIAENVAPYDPEPSAPPSGDFRAHVQATNQITWDGLFDWYASFQKERMKITREIHMLADSLTILSETDEEKIASVYHWMQKDIRYISIKGAASSGVSGHPASYTLERGFGDCTDKSILFSTLLQAAGIEAYPVYVGTNRSVAMLDPEVPGYYGNHCITEVFLADSSFYLDATGSTNGGYSRYPSFSSGDHGVYAVNAQKRKVELIPVPPAQEHLRSYTLEIEVDKQGNLLVSARMDFNGPYETAWRATLSRLTRKEDQRLRFEKIVNSIAPGARLQDFSFTDPDDFSTPLSLSLTYVLSDYVKFAGSVGILDLPVVDRNLRFSKVTLAERKLPLVYSTSSAIRHDIKISLPRGWKIAYLPKGFAQESDEVKYNARYLVEGKGIRFIDTYERQVRKIEPDRYPKFKALLTQIGNYHQKPILLSINGGSDET